MIKTNEHRGGGVATYMSWERLGVHLRLSGELKKDEWLDGVVVDDYGVTLYIKQEKRR